MVDKIPGLVTKPSEPPTRTQDVLERLDRIKTRLDIANGQLGKICSELGVEASFDPPPQPEDVGFGFLGALDVKLRFLFDVLDDLEGKCSTIDELF